MKAKLTLVFKRLERHVVNQNQPLPMRSRQLLPTLMLKTCMSWKPLTSWKSASQTTGQPTEIKKRVFTCLTSLLSHGKLNLRASCHLGSAWTAMDMALQKANVRKPKNPGALKAALALTRTGSKNTIKKCTNCGGDHHTFPNSFPVWKEVMKTSQEKDKERESSQASESRGAKGGSRDGACNHY